MYICIFQQTKKINSTGEFNSPVINVVFIQWFTWFLLGGYSTKVVVFRPFSFAIYSALSARESNKS